MPIRWQHKVPDPSHPVDPHHTATGDWVCYQCREPVTDGGKAISMSFPKVLADAMADHPPYVDPEQPGLATEGS